MPVLDGIGMHDGWDWAIGALMMVLVWGAIIWGGIYLWAKSRSRDEPGPAQILRERFARGEIEADELETRLAELRRRDRH